MSKTTPNAEQKKWMSRVAQYARQHGSFPYGNKYNFQIHHVEGRTKQVNSLQYGRINIGHWFILPIDFNCHSPFGNDEYHVSNSSRKFKDKFGTQVSLFFKMIKVIEKEDGILPFGEDVICSILNSTK